MILLGHKPGDIMGGMETDKDDFSDGSFEAKPTIRFSRRPRLKYIVEAGRCFQLP